MTFRIIHLFPTDPKRTKLAFHQKPSGYGVDIRNEEGKAWKIGEEQSAGVTGQSPVKRQIKWGTVKRF